MNQPYQSLNYLYGQLRKAKQAYGKAEYRKGVTGVELANIAQKIETIDWLIELTRKYGDDFNPN